MSLLSFFFLGEVASNPKNYKKSIEVLDSKKADVLKLTALTTASSTAISMIPGDTATPIANKLADLTSWLLLVLCSIILEKYLLTITGVAAFKLLIPIAFVLISIRLFWHKDFLIKIAIKMGVFGICLFLAIPSSTYISNVIEKTYETSLQTIINDAESINNEIKNETETKNEELEENQTEEKNVEKEQSFLDSFVDRGKEVINDTKESAQEFVSNIKSLGSEKIAELTNKAEKILNSFIEATAVMVITSCAIPLLVIAFYLWLMKVIVGIDINVNKFGLTNNRKEK